MVHPVVQLTLIIMFQHSRMRLKYAPEFQLILIIMMPFRCLQDIDLGYCLRIMTSLETSLVLHDGPEGERLGQPSIKFHSLIDIMRDLNLDHFQ